jgi:hypothetical protein
MHIAGLSVYFLSAGLLGRCNPIVKLLHDPGLDFFYVLSLRFLTKAQVLFLFRIELGHLILNAVRVFPKPRLRIGF